MAPRKNKGKEKIDDEVASSFSAKCSVKDNGVWLKIVVPEEAKILMDYEAALLLQHFYDGNAELFRRQRIEMTEDFISALQYVNEAVHYSDIDYVNDALGNLREYGATDEELLMLGNTCPESCEEAFALVPSLKTKITWIVEALGTALVTLGQLKVIMA